MTLEEEITAVLQPLLQNDVLTPTEQAILDMSLGCGRIELQRPEVPDDTS